MKDGETKLPPFVLVRVTVYDPAIVGAVNGIGDNTPASKLPPVLSGVPTIFPTESLTIAELIVTVPVVAMFCA